MANTDWNAIFEAEAAKPYWSDLQSFVTAERRDGTVYPPESEVFAAFDLTPLDQVKVVILGQDPYHGPGQAHGLSFSVGQDQRIPPSLANIFKECQSDLGLEPPSSGSLVGWAQQGVLLLNTCLTVRAAEAASHRGKGWELLTDRVIEAINLLDRRVVFILWGTPARKKSKLIDQGRHWVLESPHPSPLSAYRGFFGSAPFSQVNKALIADGQDPVSWGLTSSDSGAAG